MKKLFLFLLLPLTCFAFDQGEWEDLYQGNWSISHKRLLLEENSGDPEDLLIAQLKFAYLFYRMGDMQSATQAFQLLDSIIEDQQLGY